MSLLGLVFLIEERERQGWRLDNLQNKVEFFMGANVVLLCMCVCVLGG